MLNYSSFNGQGQSQNTSLRKKIPLVAMPGEIIVGDKILNKEDALRRGYIKQEGFVIKGFDISMHPSFQIILQDFGEEKVREFCLDKRYGEDVKANNMESIIRFVTRGLASRAQGKFKRRE